MPAKHIIFFLLLFLIACNKNDLSLKDGDLIFQTSQSSQSQAIQIATKSSFSHMGIIFIENGKKFVYEAVGPVKYTPLEDWIKKGINGHFFVKRLKNSNEILTSQNIKKLKAAGESFKGRPYDFVFGWSDDKLYCSELVWKMYNRALNIQIGRPQHLGDFDLSHPLVKQKLSERYPDGIPLKETVISPEQIFRSDLLVTVLEK
ncbi:MAG: YiiX family permuted papain-like enzyme [Bacteroidetes bacterium]|nr:YiiX family permuted papain-like enzyme [Bacteroidota bacterium]